MLPQTAPGLQVLVPHLLPGPAPPCAPLLLLTESLTCIMTGRRLSQAPESAYKSSPSCPSLQTCLSPTLCTPKLSPQSSHNPISADKAAEGSDILLCVQSLPKHSAVPAPAHPVLLAFAARHPQHRQALGQDATPSITGLTSPMTLLPQRQPSYHLSSCWQCGHAATSTPPSCPFSHWPGLPFNRMELLQDLIEHMYSLFRKRGKES